MGDPRKLKNKYSTPSHPWEKIRLDAEKPLMKEYGLVNKKELWKVASIMKGFKDTAKKLVASKTNQAVLEKKQLIDRLKSYGLIGGDNLEEVLGLEINQVLDRRLQTVVFKKGLARSVKQSRQMITHRHVAVKGIKVTAPSYLVKVAEEDSVAFVLGSNFVNEDHPERTTAETIQKTKKELKETKVESKTEEPAQVEVKADVEEKVEELVPEVEASVEEVEVPEQEEVKEAEEVEEVKEVKEVEEVKEAEEVEVAEVPEQEEVKEAEETKEEESTEVLENDDESEKKSESEVKEA